ncbi:MAG TPA: alkaline phosphatase family protein [Polyangiaceae bacterium]|jgi:hypothetical protein|nr:alkaline phosphatase family protein [Polyangiaceae bacterium]
MNPLKLLLLFGITSLSVACSSDSSPGSTTDGGADTGTGETGGTHAGTGGASAGGSAGKATGGSGGTTMGTGGSGTGGKGTGGSGTGGKGTGGSGTGGKGTGGAGVPEAGVDGAVEGGTGTGGAATDAGEGDGGLHIEHVFVIAMENHDQSQIVGDSADAPYINDTLIKGYTSTSNFVDTLDLAIPSEPHYVLVESGTNAFTDVTFTGDADPSAGNSTASTEHLVTQMKTAGVSWMSYQEDMNATSGTCPIVSTGFYAPKHDPFIFFQDVSGSPPSKTNAYCASHHAPSTQIATDLAADTVAQYNFITPNLCNDMHGAVGCPNSNTIRSGDDWLAANLPGIITYANGHHGVVFILWDEGVSTLSIPFLAIGPTVKKNYIGKVKYTHASVIKSVETIFGLPFLDKVKNENDFVDLFEPGSFP